MEEIKKTLSPAVKAKIDEWMQRYPQNEKRSAVLEALKYAQAENNNWLDDDLMAAVADYLEMPKITVYEIVSFYTLYNTQPVGRHTISVCTNISCMLQDSHKIMEHLKQRLQVEVNGTTKDGKFTLREVECLAACAAAPMFQIDKKYYEYLTPEKVDVILDELE